MRVFSLFFLPLFHCIVLFCIVLPEWRINFIIKDTPYVCRKAFMRHLIPQRADRRPVKSISVLGVAQEMSDSDSLPTTPVL